MIYKNNEAEMDLLVALAVPLLCKRVCFQFDGLLICFLSILFLFRKTQIKSLLLILSSLLLLLKFKYIYIYIFKQIALNNTINASSKKNSNNTVVILHIDAFCPKSIL